MADNKLQVRDGAAVAIADVDASQGPMERVEDLVAGTLAQLHSALDTTQVVGDPIKIGDTTVIPLLSVGMGFGAGRGGASVAGKNGGQVGVGAGGGGVRPIAMLIAGPDGVRIEPVGGQPALERLVSVVDEKLSERDKSKEK